MDRFQAIDAFVRVAEAQSFAAAARQMRVSRSVITERIQQLEAFIGAPLFHRNTRSVRLSDLGQAFLRECVDLVGRTNEVVDQMRGAGTAPVGKLRVHALPGFVLGHLAGVLREFQSRYPQVSLEMVVNDAAIDPVKEGFDCALQIFPPRSEELVSRRLFPVRRVFCATPAYLEQHGRPLHPREMQAHRIGWYSGYPTRERVVFHGPDGPYATELAPVMLTNSVHLLREYAEEHAGIVCLPTLVAGEPVLAGKLSLVLPQWQLSSFWLSVFYPALMRSSLKLRFFLEMLNESFHGGEPPWDQALLAAGLIDARLVD
ncbi:LysR substrate-binding domain-containing protein [Leptothrix sp. BB-4]